MARRLHHNQPDPLPLKLLELKRLDYFWGWLQDNLNTFDDYTPFSKWQLYNFLFGANCQSFEIGDGVGLSTLVFDGVNAYVQMVMLDWGFRDYIGKEICKFAFEHGATRVTATVSDDREVAREFVSRLGFEYEGTMRFAFERQGLGKLMDPELNVRLHGVEVWGLLKERFQNGSSGSDSSGSSGSDGDGGGVGDIEPGGEISGIGG